MALTAGTGPFAPHRNGALNFELPRGHVLYLHPIPQRVRGELAGETVVDSRRAHLMHETGILPVWYFPREDVREDVLRPSDHRTHCPFKGEAQHWSVVVGERVARDAMWAYPNPLEGAPDGLGDLVAFYFDRLDRWFEEDEERLGHPRDPYHRIDVLPSSARVRVLLAGETLAETTDARILFETGLPARYYVPPGDVDWDLLTPLPELRTRCAYKGLADEWWTAQAGGERVEGAAWRYRDPVPEMAAVAGRVAFYNEFLDIEVDGVRQTCPPSPFGAADWVLRALEHSPHVR